MNILKKVILFTIISILLLHNVKINVYASTNTSTQTPVKIAMFLNNFNNPFMSNIKRSLEDIQKENENKVQFTFFDAKDNQAIQNENISNVLISGGFDLFVVNLVSTQIEEFQDILNRIEERNIPLILYKPTNIQLSNLIKPYHRAIIISGNDEECGILQGKILIDAWNTNKKTIDKNKDNIMQYVMLQGPANSPETIGRSKYSIQAINESGIKTQQISSTVCNWERECARNTIESTFLAYNNKIEVIIANNDDMAIGSIQALQKYGYNKGDKSKYIPVVGVDALPEAQELIKQGFMTGTVMQDFRENSNAIYTIGMNMVSGIDSLNGTNYKFDETGNTIRLPYYPYTK